MAERSTSEVFLFGDGRTVVKFPNPGTTVECLVAGESETRAQTDPVTKKIRRWEDGSPRMQLVVPVDLIGKYEKEDEEDAGERKWYVAGKNARDALRDALLAAKVRELKPGGKLTIKRGTDGPNNAHTFTIKYAPPKSGE